MRMIVSKVLLVLSVFSFGFSTSAFIVFAVKTWPCCSTPMTTGTYAIFSIFYASPLLWLTSRALARQHDRLAHAGQGFDAIACQCSRRINCILEPRPARQAFL